MEKGKKKLADITLGKYYDAEAYEHGTWRSFCPGDAALIGGFEALLAMQTDKWEKETALELYFAVDETVPTTAGGPTAAGEVVGAGGGGVGADDRGRVHSRHERQRGRVRVPRRAPQIQ